MEIEKKRETSWKILLNEKKNKVELTSVEVSGEVRNIRVAIQKENKHLEIEMVKEEFYNFLSLISAFKDVLIGNSSKESINMQFNQEEAKKASLSNKKAPDQDYDNKNGRLDPKEWDPW